jgi:hypothetical protein
VGWPLDKLLDQLASPDVKRRRKAAQEMIDREHDPVDDATVRRVARDDPDDQVRGCAVMELYLREARDEDAAAAYRRAIADTEWQGLMAGLNGLAIVGNTADIGLLEPYARNKDSVIADAARWSIQDIEAGGRRFDRDASSTASPVSPRPAARAKPPTGPGVIVVRAGGWRAYGLVARQAFVAAGILNELGHDDLSSFGDYLVIGTVFALTAGTAIVWLGMFVRRKWFFALTSEGIEHPRFGLIPWAEVREGRVEDGSRSRNLIVEVMDADAYFPPYDSRKGLRRYFPANRWISVSSLMAGGSFDDLAVEITRRAKVARRAAKKDSR